MTHNPLSTAHFPAHLITVQGGRVNDVDLMVWLRNLRPGPARRFYKAACIAIAYGADLSNIQEIPYNDKASYLL